LDVGDKRIGIAVSDQLGLTAQFVGTLVRSQTAEDLRKLRETAEEYGVACVVVGVPKKLNGTSSPQTKKVEEFVSKLREKIHVPVRSWDERLTTASAEAALLEANVRRRARRKVVDSVAAQIMLQHYLDCARPPGRSDCED
jgi:putative Holliday junction resolvase